MNIRTDNVESLLKQQELQAKRASAAQSGAGEGFGAVFAEQGILGNAGKNAQTEATTGAIEPNVVQQLLISEVEQSAASGEGMTKAQVLDHAAGALDMWDSYVDALRTSGTDGNLRDAYSLLEGVDAHVATLKAGAEPVLEQNPQLAGLVNELEVLSATEKFKFNRGDYVSA